MLSPDDLANLLGIPIGTVYQWRLRGTGPRGYRVGRHVRYSQEDINRWLEQRADKPQPTV